MSTEEHLVWDQESNSYIQPKQRKPKRRFVKGPIPLAWISKAAQLPGKALHVGMAIWYVRGLKKCDTFPITRETTEQFGLTRQALYRGLDNLELAGLISQQSQSGRSKIVTIKKTDIGG